MSRARLHVGRGFHPAWGIALAILAALILFVALARLAD